MQTLTPTKTPMPGYSNSSSALKCRRTKKGNSIVHWHAKPLHNSICFPRHFHIPIAHWSPTFIYTVPKTILLPYLQRYPLWKTLCVYETQMPLAATMSKFSISSIKVTRIETLVSFKRVSLVQVLYSLYYTIHRIVNYACKIYGLYHLRFKSYGHG